MPSVPRLVDIVITVQSRFNDDFIGKCKQFQFCCFFEISVKNIRADDRYYGV